ncbi:MAG: VOC family protein [Alphaproteobacteria bacterium]|nr:VOC family protein [Alphaproteobacteria bacterium]
MDSNSKLKLTHMALFVRDLDKMADFYTNVLGLTVTDQGEAKSAPVQMVFMSSDPGEHHQFVLVDGRPEYATFSVAQQISFLVDSLDDLRAARDRVAAAGSEIARTTTHGNAWSIYFDDPEGNQIEVYAHSPWHIPQPHVHPFDLSLPNDEILRQTEAHCREDPGFMPVSEREKEMKKKMGLETPSDAGMDRMRESIGKNGDIWP